MQTNNRLLDDLAKVANGAMSVAAGMRQEIEQLIRQQLERFLNDRDLVTREEFEAVKAMAVKAREEQEALAARLEALEKAAKPTRRRATKAKSSADSGKSDATSGD